MYANGSRTVNCVFSVTIAGELQQGRIDSAFAKLQAKHPLLRAVIKEDRKCAPYFDIRTDMVPAVVEVLPRNTEEDWIKVAQVEWHRPFNYNRAPLMRVLWLNGGAVSDLVIVLPHCVCDGGTIVNLMRELLSYTGDPSLEAIPYDTFSGTTDLITANEMPGKGAQIRARLLSHVARGVLSILIRNKQEATGMNYYMIRWSLDRNLSQQVINACKAGGTSVQAALGIAFLTAFGKVMGKDAKNKLICPVDIRKSVPGIKEDMMFAFAPVVELSGTYKEGTAYWEQARRMKADLQEKISRLRPAHLLVLTEYFHRAADKMLKHLRTVNGSHDITLSNMGKLELPDAYNGFKIKRVYSPSTALPWKNPNTLVVTSFGGQLDFSLISEESFLAREKAQAVREAFMDLLKEAVTVTA